MKNNKELIMKNTYALNETLHKYGILEKLRSQFVGTCLLALKNGLDYSSINITTSQIIDKIEKIINDILQDSIEKDEQMKLLVENVLKHKDIISLDVSIFQTILNDIEKNILPFIIDGNALGQDLLNLFFVTFNKYVGKSDKNQAFTPDHIADFMCKIVGVNQYSRILDPCCGSGSFLVKAMSQALNNCNMETQKESIKKEQIYGIECDENVFGLAITNMLLHADKHSNIINKNCFTIKDWIQKANPTVILMNPPYNAQRKHMPQDYICTWTSKQKEDPTKGLYFVKYIADIVNELNKEVALAVLLPVSCAIGNSKEIKKCKEDLLKENTLDAVFTLPDEIFYPGASASSCCMVFKLGKKHNDKNNPSTFFGYYKEDGFKKKKNIGRVEQIDGNTQKSKWEEIEKQWLNLYQKRKVVDGYSATQKVSFEDEWLCEAYMKTDYSKLKEKDFKGTLNDYISYMIKRGSMYES